MSLVEKALKKLQDASREQGQVGAPSLARGSAAVAMKPVQAFDVTVHQEPLPPARTVTINMARLRAAGLLPPEDQERHIAQQYRQIKRPLIAAATGRGANRLPKGNVIVIASAMPGEGKTFTCLNLALSLALEKDLRVLLVDADLAKPNIGRELGIAEEPGLLDLLRDPKLDAERFVMPTDVPRLSVLSAGTTSEDATELLASARMEEVVRALGGADGERIVLFDSPPLLLTTESRTLAQSAGQVVVVVCAGVTSQDVLTAALSYIAEGPALSLVLNQSTFEPSKEYYYYGSVEGRETENG